jgi:hypothetical protein
MDVSTLHLSNQRHSTLRMQTQVLMKLQRLLRELNDVLEENPNNYTIRMKKKCVDIIAKTEQEMCSTLLESIVDAFEHPSTNPVRIYKVSWKWGENCAFT